MKNKIIFSVLLMIVLSAGLSVSTNAAPWRHYGYGYGRPAVRVYAPARIFAPPIVVGGYYGPRYCAPHYYRHGYRR
jgi:hypothetical protein